MKLDVWNTYVIPKDSPAGAPVPYYFLALDEETAKAYTKSDEYKRLRGNKSVTKVGSLRLTKKEMTRSWGIKPRQLLEKGLAVIVLGNLEVKTL